MLPQLQVMPEEGLGCTSLVDRMDGNGKEGEEDEEEAGEKEAAEQSLLPPSPKKGSQHTAPPLRSLAPRLGVRGFSSAQASVRGKRAYEPVKT